MWVLRVRVRALLTDIVVFLSLSDAVDCIGTLTWWSTATRIGLRKAVTTLCSLHQAAQADAGVVDEMRRVVKKAAVLMNARRHVYVRARECFGAWLVGRPCPLPSVFSPYADGTQTSTMT